MDKKETICAVVVTYNRKDLLLTCLDSLRRQTYALSAIYIIDNASNDGTPEILRNNNYIKAVLEPRGCPLETETVMKESSDVRQITIHYVRMYENTGGAGGFHEGVKRGYEKGYDWLWLMDDDSEPGIYALERLIDISGLDDGSAYASAVYIKGSKQLAWPKKIYLNGRWTTTTRLPDSDEFKMIKIDCVGFLGAIVSRRIVSKVGFPNRHLFIRGDEVEYSLRIKNCRFDMYVVPSSSLYHPSEQYEELNLIIRKNWYVKSGVWKSYYFVRNSIYILRYYPFFEAYFLRLPWVIFKAFFIALVYEDRKMLRVKYYAKAVVDGLFNRLGKRVEPGDV